MKCKLLFVILIALTGILSAQDTIFVKNGQVIPATIVEKNKTEIKYKRYGQTEPAAIYSIFISDIRRIHYMDGIVADYTLALQPGTESTVVSAIDNAGTMKSVKFSFAFAGNYFNRNESDDLLVFWKDKLANANATIGGNQLSFPFSFKLSFWLGNSGRNILGDELQIIITPPDAIYASNNDGSYEIKLGLFYYNIILFYGRSLNHKKNLFAIIEPGLDLTMMNGYIKLNGTEYKNSLNFGAGFHIGAGVDWNISKRFTASGRIGQRFLKIKEQHLNSQGGYSNFYVLPGVSEDLLSIKWNGPYASLGLSWSFYTKMKTGVETANTSR